MSIYRELLRTDNKEVSTAGIVSEVRSEIEKLAGFIDYHHGTGKTSFLFTATESGEGSTFVLAQTALLLAQLNKNMKILVIDANLRTPDLHNHFNVSKERGLQDFLEETDDALPVQQHSENLGIITAGSKSEGQFARSGLSDLHRLLDKASNEYDIIMIDSPAARWYADAVALAPAVDGIILTIAAGVAGKGIIKTVIESLNDAGGEILGTVFNRRKDEIPSFIYRRL
jgi:Mrp family chromosome partitioning ATPase